MWDLEEKLAILIISSLQIMTDSSHLENKPAVWLVGRPEITWSRNKYLLEEENHLVCGKIFYLSTAENWDKISNIWNRKNENHQALDNLHPFIVYFLKEI